MKRTFILVVLFFLGLGTFFLNRAILGREVALPGDILVGHYYPWRDYVWDGRDSGYPIKNFDLNDAVVQFFPWRKFTTEQLSRGVIPFRNPFNFLGTPHLANIATAVFYPPTLLFHLLPMLPAWNIFVLLQIVLAGIFMYLYLANLKLDRFVAIFGGVVFCLSSFFITTLEFSIIGHTVLWAPLVLLSIDKLLETKKTKYLILGAFAVFCLFLAGFIQMSLYMYLLSLAYFFYRAGSKNWRYLGVLLFPPFLAMFQLLPFAEVALASSRIAGYFDNFSDARKYLVPVNRLIGGLIPDYFGSPATGNFFGGVSYTEFAFYMGIPVVLFVFYVITKKKESVVKFWFFVLLVSLVFAVSNPVSKLVHTINIPFYSSLLPSRLLSVVTISLAVLSSFGLAHYKNDLAKNRKTVRTMVKILALVLFIFSFYTLDALAQYRLSPDKGGVSLRNIVFPFFIFGLTAISMFMAKINLRFWICFIIFVSVLDLTRQGWKYNSFIKESLVFPKTASLDFLSGRDVPPRVVMSHQELLPAEANVYYGFSLLGGYDSVHSAKTEKLLNTLNYQDENLKKVSGRVVFVSSLTSRAYDILSPEYYFVLSETEYPIADMELFFSEGRTKIYKNLSSYPRAFLTKNIQKASEDTILSQVLAAAEKHEKIAYLNRDIVLPDGELEGSVELMSDNVNQLLLSVSTNTDAVVVLNESYDKNWKAEANGQKLELFEVNYHLIGFVAPPGDYEVTLTYHPESFYNGLTISGLSLLLFIGYLFSLRSFRSNSPLL